MQDKLRQGTDGLIESINAGVGIQLSPPLLVSPNGSVPAGLSRLAALLLGRDSVQDGESAKISEISAELQTRFYQPLRGRPAYSLEQEPAIPLTAEQLSLARSLGFIDAQPASRREHDVVILFGGLYSAVERNLSFLLAELQRNQSPGSKLLFLGSNRRLLPAELWGLKSLLGERSLGSDRPQTEIEMMELLWFCRHRLFDSQRLLPADSPASYIDMTAEFICAYGDTEADYVSTADTLAEMFRIVPAVSLTGARILAGSTQPYVRYQSCILANTLLSLDCRPLSVDVIGPAANENALNADAFGNNLAKLLYEEHRLWVSSREPVSKSQSR